MGKSKREIPLFEFPIIETHCHLDYLKDRPLEETLKESQRVGIEKIITITVTKSNLDSVLQLAKNHDHIFCTQGIHPHEAKDWSQEIKTKVTENTQRESEKVLAIGEIGLDFYYNNSPKQEQLDAFNEQFELAISLEKPIVVHSRDAELETKEILDRHAPNLKRKGVIHSFTSKLDLAEKALEHDFYLGFNGIITFKTAEEVREAVKLCPLERILLETDSPFLTPVPFRGRENAPFYLPFIAEKIAEIKEIEVEEVLKVTYQNSIDLFF